MFCFDTVCAHLRKKKGDNTGLYLSLSTNWKGPSSESNKTYEKCKKTKFDSMNNKPYHMTGTQFASFIRPFYW
jgi:hypothetical protein